MQTVERLITVLVDKYQRGWTEEAPAAWHTSVPLLEALQKTYPSDAHFMPYWLEVADENGVYHQKPKCPRMTLSGLDAMMRAGGRLRFGYGVADIDCEEAHRTQGEAPAEWRRQMADLAERTVAGCCWYATRGGLRIIWKWAEPLDPIQHAAAMRHAIAALRDAGLPVDNLFDWGRLFRLPRVVRDGEPQDPEGRLVEPDVWTPPLSATVEAIDAAQPPASIWDGLDTLAPRFALPQQIPAGERHHTLKRYAASLRARNCERDEIGQRLQEAADAYYAQHGKAKDADKDLENILDWACSLPAGPSVPQSKPSAHRRPPPIKSIGLAIDPAVYQTPLERGDSVELAELVLSVIERHSGVPAVYAMGALWAYVPDLGRYVEVDRIQLQQAIASTAGMLVKGKMTSKGVQQYSQLKLTSSTVMDVVRMVHTLRSNEDAFDGSLCVAFSDCVVEVTDKGVVKHPHAAKWRCTVGYDEPYTDLDPTAWLKFLAEVWSDRPAAELAIEVGTAGEWIGAMLTRQSSKYQKALFPVGGGSNGKSTFVSVVEGLVPRSRVTHFAPQHFGNEGNKAKLAKAMLNSTAEVPSSEITDVAAAVIKALVSGDPMHGRYLYENVIDFTPNCGVLLACNTLPSVKDLSEGMWRRIRTMPFNAEFKGAGVVRDLAKELLDKERTQVVCWALRCLPALLVRGEYVESASSSAMKAQWRSASDEVEQWMADLTDSPAKPGEGTPCDILYSSFRIWASSAGIPDSQVLTKRKFFDRLKVKVRPFTAGPATARRIEYPLLIRAAASQSVH